MERHFDFETGEYYHIYNRGIEKRTIFLDDRDRTRFQNLLYLANSDKPVVFKRVQGLPLDTMRGEQLTSILAYSLMPNHFHIIGRENKYGGLSKFMAKLSTSYSMYFNTKYERSGSLFCHPYRARHIHFDDYFRWVFSYVHLNPLDIFDPAWEDRRKIHAEKAAAFIKNFPYSSYADYFGKSRPQTKIIHRDALPIPVSDLESIEKMLKEYRQPPEDCNIDQW